MKKEAPVISTIVCTYNRAVLLEKTLESLIRQKPGVIFDILVIDNNSSDSTKEVVEKIIKKSALSVSYFLEKELGIAIARNRGADLSTGKYIAYIDDDAIPSPDWLKEIVSAFEGSDQKPACCVGKVKLNWEKPKPKWFPKEHETLLGKYDFGSVPKFLGSKGYLVTMNAAFDRAAFLKIGKFKTYLGRKGNCLLSGEDNNMYDRLYQSGLLIHYNPDQLIYHFVPKERQTIFWLTKRLFWDGATQIIIDFENKEIDSKKWLFKAAYDIKTVFLNLFLSIVNSFILKKEKLIQYFLRAVLRTGRIYMAFVFFGFKKKDFK